jgi:putative nucleotidyltransferase with HDIG domain
LVDRYEPFLKNLPVMPDVAARILSITEDRLDVSFRELERIVKVDPGLSARILQIANSALYARQREIRNLQTAISLMGFKNIKSLVLLVSAATAFRRMEHSGLYRFFWRSSIVSAFLARDIALRCSRKENAEEAFLGGLLHDIGQFALFLADPGGYEKILAKVQARQGLFCTLEREHFGVEHREIGAYALEKWNFPELFVDAAREHDSLTVHSAHRNLVMVISAASLIGAGFELGFLPAEKEAMLREILSRLDLGPRDLEYFRTSFLTDLHQDPLFRECQGLFGLQ